jgi:hypothetical protein
MADGTQVKILSSNSALGPAGKVTVLSASVAAQKIASGEVQAFGTAGGDGAKVQIIAHGSDYPFGAKVTLSASVAASLIARGLAELSS